MPINYFEPYTKVQAYLTLPDAENLLAKVADYIIDMPAKGHTPFDSNDCPRARIARYLYWDSSLPLTKPLPTPAQKKSIIYNPEKATEPPDAERGYRIYKQTAVEQSQTTGKTRLYIFMGNTIAKDEYTAEVSIVFRVLCSMVYDTNTKETALSRSYAIVKAIIEALNGVNMAGVGTFYFDRRQHPDCYIRYITDESHNVGYQTVMGLTVKGEEPETSMNQF